MHFDNLTAGENYRNGTNFTVFDFSTSKNNGTGVANSSNGGPQLNISSGKFGAGLVFDGSNDQVVIPDSTSLTVLNNVTLSAWINPKSLSADNLDGIVQKWCDNDNTRQYQLTMFAQKPTIYISTTGSDFPNAQADQSIPLNTWTFVTGTYDSSNIKIYVNGILNKTTAQTGNLYASSNSVRIGGYGIDECSSVERRFDGSIDEVAVWNRSLSDLEIANLYNLSFQSYFQSYYFKANATDAAGNVNQTPIVQFRIVGPPFDHSINSPLNNTNTSDSTVQIEISNGTDPASNQVRYYLEVDNNVDFSSPEYVNTSIVETINTTNDTTSSLADNLYYFRVRIYNNRTVNGSYTQINNFRVDTKLPNLTINIPINLSNFSRTNIEFNITSQDPTLVNVSILGNWSGNFIINTTNSSANLSDNSINFSINITQADGQYLWSARACDLLSNCNNTPNRTIIIDTKAPNIVINSPINNTNFSYSNITFNITATDPTLINISIIGNWTGSYIINQTNSTPVSNNPVLFTINVTQANGYYTWYSRSCDQLSQCNSSSNHTILIDRTFPNLTINPSSPNNLSSGINNITINYTVVDTLDSNISCNITLDNIVNATIGTTNNTATTYTINNIKQGNSTWYISCYDDAININNSEKRIYIAAIINVSSPVKATVYRPDEVISIGVTELSGTSWIDGVSVIVLNQTYNLTESSNNWSLSYTIPGDLTPREININATAYSLATGVTINVTNSIHVTLTRPTAVQLASNAPVIDRACSNETFIINNTNKTIIITSNLDTLIDHIQANITTPGNTVHNLSTTTQLSNSSDYVYQHNFTYTINETGTYTLSAYVVDLESNSFYTQQRFYSTINNVTANLSGNEVSNIRIVDLCSGNNIVSGTSVNPTLANASNYTIVVEFTDPINITFREALFNSSLTKIVNYTNLLANLSTPSDQRRVITFEIVPNISYKNITWTYYYGGTSYTINNESSLRIYYCSNISNCSLQEVNFTLDTTANTISYNSTNLSVFMVTEVGSSTTTVTNTVTNTQSQGNTKQFVALDIIAPSPVSLYLNDKIIVPITFRNNQAITLSKISLNADSSNKDISSKFEKSFINQLSPGQSETINLILKSETESEIGAYEVTIRADVDSPRFSDTAKLIANLIELGGANRTIVVKQILFAKDLFKENPECLELQELLDQAQESLNKQEFEKGLKLAEAAINGCKDLVTSFAKKIETPKKEKETKMFRTIIIATLLGILILKFIEVIKRKRINQYYTYGGNINPEKPIKKSRNFLASLFKNKKPKQVQKKKDIWERK